MIILSREYEGVSDTNKRLRNWNAEFSTYIKLEVLLTKLEIVLHRSVFDAKTPR